MCHLPVPIAHCMSRRIKACLFAKAENVLAGNNAEVGCAGHGELDQRPGHVGAACAEIISNQIFFPLGEPPPPTQRGIVVVSAGIDGVISVMIVR